MKTRSDVSSNKTKKTNYWKFAFLILLGVVLGSTVFLGSRIFANREPELPEI
ncbi:TPA: YpmS family protein, partial [Enterococcus faecium]|nr:YpmS family protein [Enterococcus faecium]HAX1332926.1 YpmS family protein [Enterococcus faecium]